MPAVLGASDLVTSSVGRVDYVSSKNYLSILSNGLRTDFSFFLMASTTSTGTKSGPLWGKLRLTIESVAWIVFRYEKNYTLH